MTTAPTQILSADEQIVMLQKYVSEGSKDTDMVTRLIGKVIESGAWSSFTDQLGNHVQHQSFQEFVTRPRWDGLGTTRTALTAWVREQDQQVADLVERAWRGEIPAAPKHGVNQHSPSGVSATNSGQTSDGIVARLKRDDPALAESVVAGELSPNAAALRLGWRKPRIVATNPSSVARKLRQIWDDQQIEQLIFELEANR